MAGFLFAGVAARAVLRLLSFVAAIFVAVFVLDADLHAASRPVFIEVTATVVIAVRIVAVAIPARRVSSTIPVAVALHSRVGAHLAAIAAHTLAVAAAHAPHLTVVGPRLVAAGPLIPRLLG